MPISVRVVLSVFGVHLAIGAAAYLHFVITGRYEAIRFYFGYEGAVFLIIMPLVEVWFAGLARSAFDSDEPMRLAWTMILFSALLRFVGAVAGNVSHWASLRDVGVALGGPVSMVFLAVGLGRIVTLQRRMGLARLTRVDFLLFACIFAITLRQTVEIGALLFVDHIRPTATEAMLWFSDPLLTVLLAQTVVVRRSVLGVGHGLVARCWGAIALGVIFTSAGNLLTWMNRQALMPEVLQPIAWYTWFAAAASFGIAPCFQAAASAQARRFEPRRCYTLSGTT